MKPHSGLQHELAACAAMVRLAFQTRANQGSNWLTWLVLALALLIPVLAFAVSKKLAPSIGFGAGIPLAMLAVLWWTLLLSSLARQRSHTARLVPGSGRRAVAVMLSGAALITLVLTSLFALAGGSALTAAVLVILALSFAAAAAVVPSFTSALFVLIVVQALFGEWLAAVFPSLLDDVLVPLAPVLILGLGYAALRAIYLGRQQQADFAAVLQRRAASVDHLFRFSGMSHSSAFARGLRRDCAEGRDAALLMHAVGPLGRAPSLWSFALGTAILLAVLFAAPAWAAHYRTILQALIPALMVALQLVIVPTMVQAVYKTRREQALVRLAPRAPGVHALNATLARSLLLAYAGCWLGSTLLVLVSLHFLGVPNGVLLRILAVFLMTLTWANLLLRDYASERGAAGSAFARILVMLGGCLLVLAAPASFFRPGPWLVMGCGVLAVGLVFAFLRWTRMLRAPAAFPAARTR